MAKRRTTAASLTRLWAELAVASVETMWRRSAMMARGTCSDAEYARMVEEKVAAVQEASVAAMHGRGPAAVLRPFHRAATANARRLRD